MPKTLVLKYRDANNPLGVHRKRLEESAKRLGVTPIKAAYIAIGRLNADLSDGNGDFDFPDDKTIARLNRKNKELNPADIISTKSITDFFAPQRKKRPAGIKRTPKAKVAVKAKSPVKPADHVPRRTTRRATPKK